MKQNLDIMGLTFYLVTYYNMANQSILSQRKTSDIMQSCLSTSHLMNIAI